MGGSEGYASTPAGRLFYERRGSGNPIVFLHAGFLDRRMWDPQFAEFSRNYEVVRYDRRGFGRSDPPSDEFNDAADLGHVMDALDLPSAYLVGLSDGGRTAIDFSTLHPERVDGLTVVASGLSGYVPQDSREEAMWVDLIERNRAMEQLAEGREIDRALDQLLDVWAPAVDGPTRKWLRGIASENRGPAFRRSEPLSVALEPPAIERLEAIVSPVLAITGTRDFPGLDRIAEALVARLPGAQLARVEGADHLVNLSQREAFDSQLHGFLARLDFMAQRRGSTH